MPLTTVSGHPIRFCRKVYIPGVPRETFGFKLVGIKCDVSVFGDVKRNPFLTVVGYISDIRGAINLYTKNIVRFINGFFEY